MANAFTSMSNTVLARAIFEAFLVKIAPLTRFARNFSADIVGEKGDKVRVPFVPASDSAKDFTGTYSVGSLTAQGKEVTLDGHKYVDWALTDTEFHNNAQLTLEMFAAQKANKLAQAVLADIWSIITVANFSNEIEVTAANFDSDEVADLREDATVLNWPEDLRTLILSPADMTGLLKDADIKSALNFGSSDPIQKGTIPQLSGFGLMESNLIPANAENLRSFAVYPDAILLAMRYLAPQEGHSYTEAMPFTDPESGITLGFRAWYDPNTGTKKNILECNWGKLLGNPASLIRIQTP